MFNLFEQIFYTNLLGIPTYLYLITPVMFHHRSEGVENKRVDKYLGYIITT